MASTLHSLDRFVTRTHSRAEGIMPGEAIGLGAARELVTRLDHGAMADLARESRRYLPAVEREIDTLRTAAARQPQALAERALLFGISTPNRDERDALAWALAAAPHFGAAPADMVAVPYRGGLRMGMTQSIQRALADLYAHPLTLADCVPSLLEPVHGIGPKVARMVAAVANPDAALWTVDLWHARQLLWAAGCEYRVRAAVDAAAYPTLERVWLDYAAEHFPGVAPWACQWSTWNAADGRHNPHSALWADLAA